MYLFFEKIKINKQYYALVFLCMLVFTAIPLFAAPIVSPCTSVPNGAPHTSPATFSEATCLVIGFLRALVPTIIGFGLVVFLWGLLRFISAGGDEKRVQEGKDMMIYGIIGLFVMVSVYTIVSIVFKDFFGGLHFGVPLLKTS